MGSAAAPGARTAPAAPGRQDGPREPCGSRECQRGGNGTAGRGTGGGGEGGGGLGNAAVSPAELPLEPQLHPVLADELLGS